MQEEGSQLEVRGAQELVAGSWVGFGDGACPSKGAELRPHVDDDLGGRRAEILQPAPYACLEKFSRPTELLGSQGLAAKHDTSAGHPKVWQEKKQVQEQGTCPCVPQRLFPALLPQMGTSQHTSVLVQKKAGWRGDNTAQVVETSDL